MNAQLKITLWIAIGGSLGTIARFAANQIIGVPGTLIGNILGSFILATLAGWTATRMLNTYWTHSGLGVRFCAAFTTMAALAAETFHLQAIHTAPTATLYLATTPAFGLAAATTGFAFGQRLCTTQTADETP